MVSYDDPRAICDKVEYANERGLHGFLIWEISGDMIDRGNGQMETPLIDAVNKKIQNPNFDCSSLRDPSWALSDQTYRLAPDEPDYVDWSQYTPPASTGSANDFNGAQEARLPPDDGSSSSVGGDVWMSSSSRVGVWGDSTDDDCPLDFTGYYATAACTKYVYCSNGSVVGGAQPCVPGTLFDVTIGVCAWADQVPGCG